MERMRGGRVPSETIERVREANDIVEFIGQYVELKRAGRSFKGLCPFHDEKTPSFMVNPERQMYHCFGCHKGGDVFSFLMEQDGSSFGEALRSLGARAGIEVEPRAEKNAHDALYEAAEHAARFYERALGGKPAEPARRYLRRRGLEPGTVERFRLGFAPNSWSGLGDALRGAGIAEEALVQLGLLNRSTRGTGTYDVFRNRLILPITSLSGRVVGFGGRILPEAEGEGGPKYLNTADSPIYHKGGLLYGLAEARASIRRQEAVVLTEGYLDFLTLYQAGVEHVVAACGTAFTPQQAALLHRYARRAYILGDSDPAGRRAAVRTAGLLLEHGFLVYVVELPRGSDPDSFVREHGREALETRLREAPSYVAYMKLLVDRRAGDLAVKERVVRHVVQDLARVGDPLLQELYRKELGRAFALSEAAVQAAVEQGRRARPERLAAAAGAVRMAPAAGGETRSAVLEAQRGLLRLALSGGSWGDRLAARLGTEDFEAGPPRRLFEALLAGAEAVSGWLGHLEAEDERSFATELALEDMPAGDPERLFQDYLATLREARLDAEEETILQGLRELQGRGDRDGERRLQERHRALVVERSSLRKRSATS